MSNSNKLSLSMAILVNINVMLGAGIFINTVLLAQQAGFWGFLSYACVALLMTPLIYSTARLLHYYPSGGFYIYAAQNINQFAGFVSTWSYFTGKLASAALLVHVFTSFMRTLFSQLLSIPAILMDTCIIFLFMWCNWYHLKTGKMVMYTFMLCKVIPIVTVIISCFYLYQQWHVPTILNWQGIFGTVPFVLFAFLGFEASCSLSNTIENAQKNGPKAVLFSFGFVALATIMYQFLFYLAAGPTLAHQQDYLSIFAILAQMIVPHNPQLIQLITVIFSIALACAALGGSYGILFSNHWNLYALAQHNHIIGTHALKKLNSYGIPYYCVIIEALISLFYLFVCNSSVTTMQQISAFGCVLTYTISMISMVCLTTKKPQIMAPVIAWTALASCLMLISMCLRNFYFNGPYALFIFSVLFLCGISIFYWKKYRKAQII